MHSSTVCEECGKSFKDAARLFTHQKKSCRLGKRSLRELLSGARELWKAKESRPRKHPKVTQGASRPRSRSPAESIRQSESHALPPTPLPAGEPHFGAFAQPEGAQNPSNHRSTAPGHEQAPVMVENEIPMQTACQLIPSPASLVSIVFKVFDLLLSNHV
jgi:hypothetical protein